jgi:hypothetical protein
LDGKPFIEGQDGVMVIVKRTVAKLPAGHFDVRMKNRSAGQEIKPR